MKHSVWLCFILCFQLQAQEKNSFSDLESAFSVSKQKVYQLYINGLEWGNGMDKRKLLNENIVLFTRLKVLVISDMKLRHLPIGFENLKDLDTLILQGNYFFEKNGLEYINAKRLRYLKLTNNELDIISKNIFGLKNITYLDLSRNGLKSIYYLFENLGQLKKMKYLLLNSTPTYFLPLEKLEALKYLEFVQADSCRILEFPIIRKASSIKQLSLNGNRIDTIGKSIAQFKMLEELNLRDNKIYKIAPDINLLNKLSQLDLSNNLIEQLPSFKGLESLEKLNLSGNQLKSLPPDLEYCKKLRQIWLSGNNIPKAEIENLQKALPNCNIIQ